MSNRSLETAAAEQLEDAGFFVEREVRPGGAKRQGAGDFTADLMAWGGDDDGELVPAVVVEVKAQLPAVVDSALAQLSRVASVTGARRAFFFDGRWHEAEPTFRRLEEVACPRPALPSSRCAVPRQLLMRELWRAQDVLRTEGLTTGGAEWATAIVAAAKSGASTALSRLLGGATARRQLVRALSEVPAGKGGALGIPPALAAALANLLAAAPGWRVLDPACGRGGTLWAVAEAQPEAHLEGWSSVTSEVDVARELAGFAGVHAQFSHVSFEEVLARDVALDGVVSVPPFNLRLRDRVRVGGAAADFSMGLLDRVAHWLQPGGRAVMVVAPTLLHGASAAPLRAHLYAKVRVVSVIELPSGVFSEAAISPGIVVLERAEATDTLVARLGADWEAQLAPAGDFFRVYRDHLSRGRS